MPGTQNQSPPQVAGACSELPWMQRSFAAHHPQSRIPTHCPQFSAVSQAGIGCVGPQAPSVSKSSPITGQPSHRLSSPNIRQTLPQARGGGKSRPLARAASMRAYTASAMDDDEDIVELPIDGVLDLHTFHPRDVSDLVPTWLDECKRAGIAEVRIIHGKGRGVLRRTVHAILERRDDVVEHGLAPAHLGGWGATVARLRLD